MTDYLGMRHRLWQVIWENAGDAIDKVLKEAWDDGYNHGIQVGWDNATDAEKRRGEVLKRG